MERRHHHGLYMAATAPVINQPAVRCDLLARYRLFSGHFCHSGAQAGAAGVAVIDAKATAP